MKVREVIKRIEADGWYLDRTRGDHRQTSIQRKKESAAKVLRDQAEAWRIADEVELKYREFDQSVIEWHEKTRQEIYKLNAAAALASHAVRTGADVEAFGVHIRYPRAAIVTEVPPAALPPAAVPSFTALLAQGLIQESLNRGQMILGYALSAETGQWQPRYGSWLDLYSCAVAGVLGSGKTTTALFLLMQAVLSGAKLILIDPHMACR